ncbi:hypothetical protein D3C77_477600 [compost metagenome]
MLGDVIRHHCNHVGSFQHCRGGQDRSGFDNVQRLHHACCLQGIFDPAAHGAANRVEDPGQVDQVGQRKRRCRCQRMTRARHHAHLLIAVQQLDVQLLAVALVGQTPDHHVKISAQQRRQQGVAGADLKGNAYLGMVAFVGQHRFGQQAWHRTHDTADPHQSQGASGQLRDLRLGVLELVQRALGVTNHHFAIQRRLHAPRQALEQAHAKALFKLLQQQARRRLRGVHRGGGPAQVAELAQGIEQGDLAAGDLQRAEAGRRPCVVVRGKRHIKSDIPT